MNDDYLFETTRLIYAERLEHAEMLRRVKMGAPRRESFRTSLGNFLERVGFQFLAAAKVLKDSAIHKKIVAETY